VRWLYGPAFLQATPVLWVLLCWLWLHAMRRARLTFFWVVVGDVRSQAWLQWWEVALSAVAMLFLYGAAQLSQDTQQSAHYWAVAAACSLCAVEVLLLALCWLRRTPSVHFSGAT
jgi:hypothetical protein